jgi:hypothetical protein
VRKLLLVGIALAIIGVVAMALPFARPEPRPDPRRTTASGAYVTLGSRCKAPIISAWHRDSDGGWFGYAPLTSVPSEVVIASCKPPARRRLAGGVLFVACGAAVGIVAIRRSRQDAPDLPPDAAGIE